MKTPKLPKFLIVYILIVWPIIMTCMVLTMAGNVCVSYDGFAIDQESNIYLGKDSKIEVQNQVGEVLRTIFPFTTRGYRFTITEDQTIKIQASVYMYETDLYGNLLNKKEITDHTENELIRLDTHKFVASDGTSYVMKNHFLRTYIYRLNGSEKIAIYKMPTLDYIVRLAGIAFVISMMIVVPIGIIKAQKRS